MSTYLGASPETPTPADCTVFLGLEIQAQGDVAGSSAVPNGSELTGMRVLFTGLAGVTTATAYLSEDVAGVQGLTPWSTTGATQTISVTTSGNGYAVWALSWTYVQLGGLYLQVKVDAGTYDTVRAEVFAMREL